MKSKNLRQYLNYIVLVATFSLLAACQGGLQTTATPEVHTQLLPLQQSAGSAPATDPISPLPTPMPDSIEANADVEFVSARLGSDGAWTFSVTVRHPDTGWEDYADGWDVVLPDGTVILPDPSSQFTRLLLHPHETEQPFTRSQSGIVIPTDINQVTVRAHDLVSGWGGKEVVVDLNQASGPDFEVSR